ncbi:hypothetical protein B0T18DRAFT_396312 [Schizothecium vesticola]|uniref:Uncharacterized protein n=1 Tax=Schizothecium vesticola TaxID=314040 RepID=A0AA40F9J6_9PEZI|nr:hypothetical protein B0T18DRAFT_396312 [Schizothecium vesticola]
MCGEKDTILRRGGKRRVAFSLFWGVEAGDVLLATYLCPLVCLSVFGLMDAAKETKRSVVGGLLQSYLLRYVGFVWVEGRARV